jgi:hypothetical protein
MIPIYKNETGVDVSRIAPSGGGLTRGQFQKAQLGTMAAQVVGDVVVGLIQNKTQKDFNKGKLEQLKEDSRLNQLSAEQRLAFDKKVANAVNDIAKLRVYQEELGDLGVASIQSTASIYAAKLQGDAQLEKSKTIGTLVLIGGGALLLLGVVYLLRKK